MNYPFLECCDRNFKNKTVIDGREVIILGKKEFRELEREHSDNPLTKWVNCKIRGWEKNHLVISDLIFMEEE